MGGTSQLLVKIQNQMKIGIPQKYSRFPPKSDSDTFLENISIHRFNANTTTNIEYVPQQPAIFI